MRIIEISFYQGDAHEIAKTAARLKEIEEELIQANQRWGELDNG